MFNYLFSKRKYWQGRALIFFLYFFTACQSPEPEVSSLDIATFRLLGLSGVEIEADGQDIKVVVPWGTDRTRLVPVFSLTGAGTVIPAPGKPQDFTRPVVYVVQHPSGGRKLYTIQVIEKSPPIPKLTGISHQEVALGDTVRFWGETFRGVVPQLIWTSTLGQGIPGVVERERDTLFRVPVPLALAPGRYTLAMQVSGQPVLNPPTLAVHFPAPRLHGALGSTYFPGDTLQFIGEYSQGGGYQYRGYLRQAGKEWSWEWSDTPGRLPDPLPPGRYDMRIENRTRQQYSPWQRVDWEVADPLKPHIWPNRIGNREVNWGDTLTFEVRSWTGNSTQLQLEHARGLVVVTGYREAPNQVVYILPKQGPSGKMKLRFLFRSTTGESAFLANTTVQFR